MSDVSDPTADPDLVSLKDTVLKDSHSSKLLRRLQSSKSALILSGGGGKGAYEAGVILALVDCGIGKFSAITGTSVGALNAALTNWACQSPANRDQVWKTWCTIAHYKVMRVSPTLPAKLILYCLMAIRLTFDLSHIPKLFPAIFKEHDSFVATVAKGLALTVGVVIAGWVGIATFVSLSMLAATLPWTPYVDPKVPAVLAFFVIVLVLPTLAATLGRRIALFSNRPLQEMIRRFPIAAIRSGPPPVVCTLSRRMPNGAYLPYYRTLGELKSDDEATAVLLQSAAIPEIFRPRPIDGELAVDGGVADNTPIMGAYQHRPDTLVVVYLDHRKRQASRDDLFQEEQRRLNALCRLFGTEWSDELVTWFQDSAKIEIIPSVNMRGAFGTLDFSPSRARTLVAAGYRDALVRLKDDTVTFRTTEMGRALYGHRQQEGAAGA